MEEAAATGLEETAGVEAAIGMKDEIDFIDEVKGRVLVAFLINLQMLMHIWNIGKLDSPFSPKKPFLPTH